MGGLPREGTSLLLGVDSVLLLLTPRVTMIQSFLDRRRARLRDELDLHWPWLMQRLDSSGALDARIRRQLRFGADFPTFQSSGVGVSRVAAHSARGLLPSSSQITGIYSSSS